MLFELQNSKTPQQTAVIFGNETLTYAGLGLRADNLAQAITEAIAKFGYCRCKHTKRCVAYYSERTGHFKSGESLPAARP